MRLPIKIRPFLPILLTIVLLSSFGCANTKQNNRQIILATTTSIQDSGILEVLTNDFERLYPEYNVKPIAVGSGEALEMGKRGDADVLLVHSPEDEKAFMKAGFGARRTALMHNYFVLIGPPNDPAKTKKQTPAAAFANIHNSKSVFVSRSDGSGTHKKELDIWGGLSIYPMPSDRYIQTGQGMAETVRIADQKQGYTLCDNGTFLALQDTISLAVVSKPDKALENEYSIIEVSSAKHRNVNKDGARAFSKYLKAAGTQIIGSFGKDKFGQSLFSIREPGN